MIKLKDKLKDVCVISMHNIFRPVGLQAQAELTVKAYSELTVKAHRLSVPARAVATVKRVLFRLYWCIHNGGS
jgi:hypothetical protein